MQLGFILSALPAVMVKHHIQCAAVKPDLEKNPNPTDTAWNCLVATGHQTNICTCTVLSKGDNWCLLLQAIVWHVLMYRLF